MIVSGHSGTAVRALAAAVFVLAARANAQSPAPAPAAAPHLVTQTLAIQGITRRIRVGDVWLHEDAAPATYSLRAPHLTGTVSTTPLRARFSNDTLTGVTPVSAQLSIGLHGLDTLRLYGQTTSFPSTLEARHADAIGGVGTSTIDAESFSLGTAANLGARYALVLPAGDLLLTLRAGAEMEPQPAGTATVYWRGTTVLGGVSLSGDAGDATLGAGLDISRSSADSLGGRNLFPGGGSFTVSALLSTPIGSDEQGDATVRAFFVRPFNDARAAQRNRVAPVGQSAGVFGTLSWDAGSMVLAPAITLLREWSNEIVTSAGQSARVASTGWTAAPSVATILSPASWLSITPELGFVAGALSQSSSRSIPRRFGRSVTAVQTLSDPIRGWWAGVEMEVRY